MRKIVIKRFKSYTEYLQWKELFTDIREVALDINKEGQVIIKYLIIGE